MIGRLSKRNVARLLIVAILVITAVGGISAWKVRSTFQTLHELSTPPVAISGEALGGDAEVLINTGPAQTAVADGVNPAETSQVATKVSANTPEATLSGPELTPMLGVPRVTSTVSVDSTGNSAGEPLSILVMGVDALPGEAIDIGVRPDALMVLHLNPSSGSCRILAIPRDTRTELPGYGQTKVNHALAVGGIPYQTSVVADLLDLPIDNYVLVDFTAFKELVDALGGITVNIPEGFVSLDGTVFTPGVQTINGERALSYARFRQDANGDFGRIERQQQIIRGLIEKGSSLDVLGAVTDLMPAIERNIRTDLGLVDLLELGNAYRSTCTQDTVTMLRIEGDSATFDDPLLGVPLSYVIVHQHEVRRKVELLLEP